MNLPSGIDVTYTLHSNATAAAGNRVWHGPRVRRGDGGEQLSDLLIPSSPAGGRGHLVSVDGPRMDFVPELREGRPTASTPWTRTAEQAARRPRCPAPAVGAAARRLLLA